MSAVAQVVDVLVLGGGPAGLAAALCLARLLHTAVVFDSGLYRNALAKHMHTVPAWDHADPAEFRAAARKNILARYTTVQFQDVEIKKITRLPSEPQAGLFEAADANGKIWLGRKVVLATGVRDVFPAIPGYETNWGRTIFHCLFCHGYEERGGESSGILAVEDMAQVMPSIHVSRMALRLSKRVNIYTNGNGTLSEELKVAAKKNSNISIDNRAITRLEKGEENTDVIIHFADNTSVTESFIAHKARNEPIGPFADQLGLQVGPAGDYVTAGVFLEAIGNDGQAVRGVFIGGDASQGMLKTVSNAMVTGGLAAVGAISQLAVDFEEEEYAESQRIQTA
jgi:thioredoxin reductase